jgi:hypothetical protein
VGKVIWMNNAAEKTFTFATLGADQDGYVITLGKEGAGNVVVDAGALKIGDNSSGQVTNSAGAAGETITLQYKHSLTMLAVVNLFGTWTEAA